MKGRHPSPGPRVRCDGSEMPPELSCAVLGPWAALGPGHPSVATNKGVGGLPQSLGPRRRPDSFDDSDLPHLFFTAGLSASTNTRISASY